MVHVSHRDDSPLPEGEGAVAESNSAMVDPRYEVSSLQYFFVLIFGRFILVRKLVNLGSSRVVSKSLNIASMRYSKKKKILLLKELIKS
jgi:hypothetical protein